MKFKIKDSIEGIFMKKLLLLGIIVGIIIVSGCIGEEKTKSETPINQEKIENSEIETVSQPDHSLSSEEIFKTEWYKIGETQQFDVGNNIIVEVQSKEQRIWVRLVPNNLGNFPNNLDVIGFIRFKDGQDNIFYEGQPMGGKISGHEVGFASPDDAISWQIEIHLVPVVPMTSTPLKTPIKLK